MKLIRAHKTYYVRDKHGSLRKVVGSDFQYVDTKKAVDVPHIPAVKEKKDEQKDN